MNATPLRATLAQALQAYPEGKLCVAFSGGPDSSALLHALAAIPDARARNLRATHVDHGLHADSASWASHCETFCKRIDVPLAVFRVDVDQAGSGGLEAAARDARYATFATELHEGEFLLTAHHADDQAETVLLKLLRGAGPQGLGGMRARRSLGAGWLWRPLLDTPRTTLAAYVREHDLACIDDPSNASRHHARNALRIDVLPRLAAHWPQAGDAIRHSAHLIREAADYIDASSRATLAQLRSAHDGSLDASAWLALHPALRGPVLDQWLHAQGLRAPTLAQRAQLRRQIAQAAADRVPLVRWPNTVVRLWRRRLHAHPPLPDVPDDCKVLWNGEVLDLPAAAGTLEWTPASTTAEPPPELEVRLGETGLHLRPVGDRHTRALRKLFQDAAIPPWQRRRCPVIHATDGTLLAVADLWQTDAGKQLFDRLKRHPRWNRTANALRHRSA